MGGQKEYEECGEMRWNRNEYKKRNQAQIKLLQFLCFEILYIILIRVINIFCIKYY